MHRGISLKHDLSYESDAVALPAGNDDSVAEFSDAGFHESASVIDTDRGGGRHLFLEQVQDAIAAYRVGLRNAPQRELLGVAVVFIRTDGHGGRGGATGLASREFVEHVERVADTQIARRFDIYHRSPVRNSERCVLLCRHQHCSSATAFAQDVRELSENAFGILRRAWHETRLEGQLLGISMGVALLSPDLCHAIDLIEASARAMAAAHFAGKGIQFFDPDANARRKHCALACDEVIGAIEHGNVVPYYQPKIDMITGEVVGAEALARLRRNGAIVMPADFLPRISGHRALVELDRAVLRSVMAQALRWQERGLRIPVAVNLSARNFDDPGLAGLLLDYLAELPHLDPAHLEIEITESLEIANLDGAVRTMTQLRAEGIKFHLDDFGTGYSSFDRLKRLPLDGIKIDQQFVRGLRLRKADRAVVESTLGIARAFGVGVIAEGVEDEATARELVALGCRVAQGYAYAPALAVDAFEFFVAARRGAISTQ